MSTIRWSSLFGSGEPPPSGGGDVVLSGGGSIAVTGSKRAFGDVSISGGGEITVAGGKNQVSVFQFLGQAEYGIGGPIVVSRVICQVEYGIISALMCQFYGQTEYSDVPESSFEIARRKLEGRARLSLYIAESTEADEIISKINAAACTYLLSDFFGKYRYIVYELPIGYAALSLAEDEIISIQEITDAKEIVSMVRGMYRFRKVSEYWQIVVHNRESSQYLQNSPAPVLKDWEVPFYEEVDASLAVQQVASYEGVPYREYKISASRKGLKLLPADFVNVSYPQRGIFGMLEGLEGKPNLSSG